MNRLNLSGGKALWTQPDVVTIGVPAAAKGAASGN